MFISFNTPSDWTGGEKELITSLILSLVIFGLAVQVLPWALAVAFTLWFFYSRATNGVIAKLCAVVEERWLDLRTAFTKAYKGNESE